MNNCGYAAYQHKRETSFVILSGVFKVGELVEPPEENEVEGSKKCRTKARLDLLVPAILG